MKQALILFTRVPMPGKTKTRLLQELSGAQCARAHTAFLRDEVRNCTAPDAWDLLIFYGSEGPVELLQKLLPGQARFFPQEGESLGEKMDRAITRTLKLGYDRCVLVGADLPELDRERIAEAFDALDRKNLVLGPTADGGYYLIGCSVPCPELFAGQRYGGSSVLENTLRAAEHAGYTAAQTEPVCDIDDPADLRALARRLTGREETLCPDTRAFLRELGWMKGTHQNDDE